MLQTSRYCGSRARWLAVSTATDLTVVLLPIWHKYQRHGAGIEAGVLRGRQGAKSAAGSVGCHAEQRPALGCRSLSAQPDSSSLLQAEFAQPAACIEAELTCRSGVGSSSPITRAYTGGRISRSSAWEGKQSVWQLAWPVTEGQ